MKQLVEQTLRYYSYRLNLPWTPLCSSHFQLKFEMYLCYNLLYKDCLFHQHLFLPPQHSAFLIKQIAPSSSIIFFSDSDEDFVLNIFSLHKLKVFICFKFQGTGPDKHLDQTDNYCNIWGVINNPEIIEADLTLLMVYITK